METPDVLLVSEPMPLVMVTTRFRDGGFLCLAMYLASEV